MSELVFSNADIREFLWLHKRMPDRQCSDKGGMIPHTSEDNGVVMAGPGVVFTQQFANLTGSLNRASCCHHGRWYRH